MSTDPINYDAWRLGLDVAQWVSIAAVAVWGYLRTKDKDNAQAIAELGSKLDAYIDAGHRADDDLNDRLITLQERVSHMPTEQDVTHLSNDIATVKAQINGISALLTRVEHQTNLIHNHLLTGQWK